MKGPLVWDSERLRKADVAFEKGKVIRVGLALVSGQAEDWN